MEKQKIVVAITGASGSIYARLLLQHLQKLKDQLFEVSVVFSDNGKNVFVFEEGEDNYNNIPFNRYNNNDFFAPFASGSAKYNAMVIIPCTMGTMGKIAHGIADDLICRAADVMLKERRKLIIVPRDMPMNLIHIRNMESITLAGGIICPAMPSYYSKPKTIEELAATVVNRVIDLIGLKNESYRWGE
ncbi:MAG: UbiX family flavin prenyltransferase [Bacteroidales bacterium]|nr:UbiX family flavin prenyltransferase [Bacteroidales bacterium]